MEIEQRTIASLVSLERKLRNSLVGRMNGKLGINQTEYYESKSKKAEKRREYNKAQINGYSDALAREIEAALYGIPDHDKFVVAVATVFEATKGGYIKRFKSYSFEIHPPAVSSNGKIVAKKRNKIVILVGPTAKQMYEHMVDQCAKEFELKKRYFPDRDSVPLGFRNLVELETGTIIVDKFYPVAIEKKGMNQLTFKSQKDMRKAILRGLEPDFDLTSETWRCDFSELNKIQRSVSTLSDWGVSRLDMTKELDRKLLRARKEFRKAIGRLESGGFDATKSKLEVIQGKFDQINAEYVSSKRTWAEAEKIKAKRAKEYIQIKGESIRRISHCGQRLEFEVLPELEDVLRTDPKLSKWDKAKEGISELGNKIDWAQRITFILQIAAALPHKG